MTSPKAPIDVPEFDVAERDRRWQVLREEMNEQQVDLLVLLPQFVGSDAHYVANEPGAVVFSIDSDPWLVIGGEDSHLAVDRPGWITQRVSATPGGSTRTPFGAAVGDLLSSFTPAPRRIAIAGLEGHDFVNVRLPEGYVGFTSVQRIRAATTAEVVDGSGIMAQVRGVKSQPELATLRAGIAVAERAATAIGEALDSGGGQADAYRAGATELMIPGVNSGVLAWCPGAWGERRPRLISTPAGPVEPGLCIATEIMANINGYEPQVAEPFLVGELLPEQRETFALNNLAFDTALAALRPGRTWGEVEREVVAVADGTPWKIDFLLHSGHDGPLLIPSDSHDRYRDVPIRKGAVFVLKPNAFPREYEVARSRSHDVNWGDTIVIEADGAKRLGQRPRVLRSYGRPRSIA